MGKIAHLLALEELEPRTITANGLWGDLCENVHLHFRNLRLEFSQAEWASMRAGVNLIGMALEKAAEEHGYEEGNPNFLVQALFDEGVKHNSAYYPNRLSIELERDNTVHVHYRDLRLHMTETEFIEVADAFVGALEEYAWYKTRPRALFEDVQAPTELPIPIEYIQPYDAGHRPGEIDDEHRAGIEYCKEGIKSGKTPRPILIDNRGQRIDGFKRYMAQKELDAKVIECVVDPFGQMGGQTHHSMFIEDEELEENG